MDATEVELAEAQRPDNDKAAGMSSSPGDMIRSATSVEPKMNENEVGDHTAHFFIATFLVLLYTVVIVSTIYIMIEYYNNDQRTPFYTLLGIFVLKTLTQILFDYANFGRFKYIWADLLQMREYVDYIHYLGQWHDMKGKYWRHPYFRAHASFVTLMTNFPSLIVQIYVSVMVNDVREIPTINLICLCATAAGACWELLNYFLFITLPSKTYLVLMTKGILTVAMRVFLAAYLVDSLVVFIYIWFAASYVIGLLIAYYIKRASEMEEKDDPLQLGICHALFAHVVAIHSVFFSFPWAPNHSILDWWHGYMILEVKVGVEAGLALAIVMVLDERKRDPVFYAVIFFAVCLQLVHYILLYFSNMTTTYQLRRRQMYTSSKIISMFVYFCTYLQEQGTGEEQPDAGIPAETDLTDKQKTMRMSQRFSQTELASARAAMQAANASSPTGKSSSPDGEVGSTRFSEGDDDDDDDDNSNNNKNNNNNSQRSSHGDGSPAIHARSSPRTGPLSSSPPFSSSSSSSSSPHQPDILDLTHQSDSSHPLRSPTGQAVGVVLMASRSAFGSLNNNRASGNAASPLSTTGTTTTTTTGTTGTSLPIGITPLGTRMSSSGSLTRGSSFSAPPPSTPPPPPPAAFAVARNSTSSQAPTTTATTATTTTATNPPQLHVDDSSAPLSVSSSSSSSSSASSPSSPTARGSRIIRISGRPPALPLPATPPPALTADERTRSRGPSLADDLINHQSQDNNNANDQQ